MTLVNLSWIKMGNAAQFFPKSRSFSQRNTEDFVVIFEFDGHGAVLQPGLGY